MRTLSRHLPSYGATDAKMPVIGKIVLTMFLLAIGYWVFVDPYKALIVLGALAALITVIGLIDRRKVAKLRNKRGDTICDFRKAFNLREVDPWIIRASYEAFSAWIGQNEHLFPLRASDSIERDLRIDPEDMWDLVLEVAQRAGYDITDWEANPLLGKIETVLDFVLLINHQPRIRDTRGLLPNAMNLSRFS